MTTALPPTPLQNRILHTLELMGETTVPQMVALLGEQRESLRQALSALYVKHLVERRLVEGARVPGGRVTYWRIP